MADSMSFSMASMYGDYLLGGNESTVESKDDISSDASIKTNTEYSHSKISFQEPIKTPEQDEKEEDLPPLIVESIYNMAFLQRPQTAVITHGEETREDSMRIEEEEDDDSFVGSKEAATPSNADIWVADDEPNSSEINSEILTSTNSPLGRSPSSTKSTTLTSKTSLKSKSNKSNAVNCCTDSLIWCVYASSQGHEASHIVQPNKSWVSSGLFPQVVVLQFQREIHIDTITVEASGVLELTLLIGKNQQPAVLQYRDGTREARSAELGRMDLVCKEVGVRADAGVEDFMVIHHIHVTGVPVNWDDQW